MGRGRNSSPFLKVKEICMNKKPANLDRSSKDIALSLINKMIRYEQSIDKKDNPSEAEKRHREFLRAIRSK
jgi:hypothetical protein